MRGFTRHESHCVFASGEGGHWRDLGLQRGQVGADQADSYTDTIRDACHALAGGAKHGRPSVLPNLQKYLCGSHVVYFLDYPDHLDVIRVLHQRQDAERHL